MNRRAIRTATFVNSAVAFGAMRIDGDGASFACHFFEITSRAVVDAAGGKLARKPQVSGANTMDTTGYMVGTAAASGGILSRERIVAKAVSTAG